MSLQAKPKVSSNLVKAEPKHPTNESRKEKPKHAFPKELAFNHKRKQKLSEDSKQLGGNAQRQQFGGPSSRSTSSFASTEKIVTKDSTFVKPKQKAKDPR